MQPVRPQQFQLIEAHQPLQADPRLRLRMNAELLEIRNALQESNLRERNVGQVSELLNLWYLEFYRFAHEPERNEVMPDLGGVIARFVGSLEEILEDPFNAQNPYPPQLFGDHVPQLLQFIVAKATDRNSLLFSQKLFAAKPAPPERIVIPNNFEEQLRMINALRDQRLQEEEQDMPGFQNMLLHLRHIEQRQAQDLAHVGEEFQEALAPVAAAIQHLGVEMPRQVEVLMAAAERHQARLERLEEDLVVLEAERQIAHQRLDQLEVATAELQIASNRLAQAIEDKKKEQANDLLLVGGLMIVSAVVTWGISQYYYGVSVTFMQCTKTFIGVGITLGAAATTATPSRGGSQPNKPNAGK